MSESMFIEAVSLARSGRKAEARKLFEQVLKADRTNEMAWLWFAECVDTPLERANALEACMRINPQAQRVRLSLTALRRTGALSKDSGLTLPVQFEDEQSDSPAKANRVLSEQDQWVLSAESSIFTVSPEQIPPEEFARVAERTETFLLKNPDMKPVWNASRNAVPPVEAVYPYILPELVSPVKAEAAAAAGAGAEKPQGKTRGAVFTLLLITLMFALLVGAAIMLRVV